MTAGELNERPTPVELAGWFDDVYMIRDFLDALASYGYRITTDEPLNINEGSTILSTNLTIDADEKTNDLDDVLRAVNNLLRAVDDHGPQPDYHRHIWAKHRAEWPSLWSAIDTLRYERERHEHD